MGSRDKRGNDLENAADRRFKAVTPVGRHARRRVAVCVCDAFFRIAKTETAHKTETAQMTATNQTKKTLYDKIWDDHLIHAQEDGASLIYIDRHLVHEVTSPQAFEGLRMAGRKVRAPRQDPRRGRSQRAHHRPRRRNHRSRRPPSRWRRSPATAPNSGSSTINELDVRQGIVHVIGPEQGFTLPGTTIVCGDSHTSTHGAFGALAHGIGTSEVEHVLATQTLVQKKARNMRVTVDGELGDGVTAKDVILAIIGEIGTAGGTGHVIEYAGRSHPRRSASKAA